MKIVVAAIMIPLSESSQKVIVTAKRHADAYEKVHEWNLEYDKSTVVEGFMTDTNQFVDRYEAKKIAVAVDQLIVPLEDTYNALYSEDVW